MPAQQIVKGQNVPLAAGMTSLRMSVRWVAEASTSVDLVALALGADKRVRSDADMVFYNQTATKDGSIVHAGKVSADGKGADDVSIAVSALPSDIHAVTIAASIDGTTFGDVAELVWLVLLETGEIAMSFTVEGMTTERALVLGELYRRGETWRLRAIGQGWDGGLAGLATDFGIDVAGDEPETNGQSDAPEEFAISESESPVDPPIPLTGDPAPARGATSASAVVTESQTPLTTGGGFGAELGVNDAVNDGVNQVSATTPIDLAPRTPGSARVIDRPPAAPGRTRVRIRPSKTKPVTAPVMTLGDDQSWGPSRLF